MTRVAFVGAGSVEFTQALATDLLSFPEFAELELALHDIDPERLATAQAIVEQLAGLLGAHPTIETHLERRAALDGADYVLNMIQVGGFDATVRDYEVPLSFGLHQTIGDTLGVGGIFRALRTFPVIQQFAGEMAELCPDAWLLNYTNPMAMLCWATYELTPVKRVVGLCHSVQNTTRRLAEIIGVPFEEVAFRGAGVNHQSWILQFERNGENLYPRLDEAIERDPDLARTVRVEMYRRLGYFPTESSEHSSEYLPWFMHDPDAREQFQIWSGAYVEWSRDNLDEYAETKRRILAGEELDLEPSLEYAPLIIHSIETGTERVIYGNVRNSGLIENLPHGCCVEVPCLVDGTGVHPLHAGALPPQCAALNRTFVNVGELVVNAFAEQSFEHVRHAALVDPNTAATLSPEQIWRLCDALAAAHGELMPGWARRAA